MNRLLYFIERQVSLTSAPRPNRGGRMVLPLVAGI